VKENKFPLGWDEERVGRVLVHYEEQIEAEAAAEDEAAFEDRKASREIAEDEKRQKAIRADGLRNAGRRADEARRLSPLELAASWEPLDEDFPEIEDPPPLDEGIFEDD
jgi:formiminotetrahydrofolate cyclodeaminase